MQAMNRGARKLAMAVAVITLIGVATLLHGNNLTSAQDAPDCAVNDLGTLGGGTDAGLSAEGRWTTEDCDSEFHLDSDAHVYSFDIVEGGRIRIDLASDDADSYLYLLDADGNRITDNDDGGGSLDARIERDLVPGTYLLEATTIGGRRQGAADFELTIGRVAGCDPEHLGNLELGTDLVTTGTWTLDTCGSRFVVQHPAFGYTFALASGGRVRIDLRSNEGDSVLSLISPTRGLISANDDGGQRRNSRIERYLETGTYLVEATTYWERDAQLASADFELTIHLIDEVARQESGFQLKIQDSVLPEVVLAGEPFEVHYRVGNVGNGVMTEDDGTIEVYAIAPGDWEQANLSIDPETGWGAGVSYHTDDSSASPISTVSDEVRPFVLTIDRPGTRWVWMVITVDDGFGEEIGFHSQWRELTVLSGLEFAETVVSVDDVEYDVWSETDDDGDVTVMVSLGDDPDAEVDAESRAKAIYTAGVGSELLDGIFDRPAIAGLSGSDEMASVSVFDPSTQTLLAEVAESFANAVDASGIAESLANGEVVNPVSVEELLLSSASRARAEFSSLANSWRRVGDRVGADQPLWYSEALAVHSQLAYAERVVAPMVEAGEIVQVAREAVDGWGDGEVASSLAELRSMGSCRSAAGALGDALRNAGVANASDLVAVDAEARVALPFYGAAIDAVVCSVLDADAFNDRFLQKLSPADRGQMRMLIESTVEAAPAPISLRIIARQGSDGRIEHGVEIVGGEQILPDVRFLSSDATVGEWHVSSYVEIADSAIGKIRTRLHVDGRIELGFVNTGGETILPDVRFLPSEMPEGIWLRSGVIEIPREASLSE